MSPRCLILLFLFATRCLPAAENLSFNHDIRPILSDKCFSCHGFDAKKRKADLRLDTLEGATSKAESGATAITPGNLSTSELWKRINLPAEDEDLMPPVKSHKTLSAAEKATLKLWLEQGAAYQKHWAFEAPKLTPVPAVPSRGAATPIDAFLAAAQEKAGVTPQRTLDADALLRRVTFTLTGLPPTLAEAAAFRADTSPEAYEKVVDRLLASPTYGEEMARHWLDLARYGDTHGLHLDNERLIWLYRDWVVQAFNRNLAFDQFTIEQIAGDLLPNATPDQQVATGFSRCNVTTSEGGAINEEWLYRYAVDRTSTTVATWMGLTAGCAVCHDHKFDPISQKEFYSLYAFFYSAADPGMDGNALTAGPTARITPPDFANKVAALDAELAPAEKAVTDAVAKFSYTDPASVVPAAPVQEQETVLIEDAFPAGANVAGPPEWVATPVHSGQKSLKVSSPNVSQYFYDSGAEPIEVPLNARFRLHVYLDPAARSKAVMLQCHTDEWKHRALWGDAKAIPGWGKPKTSERFIAGPLPKAGEWVPLEVTAEQLGLKPGDQIRGLALTQDGGTAYFDKLSLLSVGDDAHNPSKSFAAWLKPREGKPNQELSPELAKLLKAKPDQRKPAQQQQLLDYYLANVATATKAVLSPLVAAVDKLKAAKKALEDTIPVSLAMKDLEKPRESFVMMRGAYDKPGEKVEPNVPAALPPLQGIGTARPDRLALAKWLVSPEHPLTARVAVNRFWQQCFGIGLVKTASDFGSQGQPPSHPELLDYLAVTFRESGWDVKRLLRSFVTSAAFRQSAAAPTDAWQRDPENRLLARGPRMRLEAEQIRDNALFVSGLLDQTMGGRGVRPYQPPNIWEPVAYIDSNTAKYKADEGAALYRRSLYTFLKRTAPPPFMANFDGPSREQTCPVRERSNTPMQALQLMNDVQHIEAARSLAQRLMQESSGTPEARIALAYHIVLTRAPRAEEMSIVQSAYAQHLAAYQAAPEAAAKFIRQGASRPPVGLAEPELAAWTLIANLVLNLDETVNRN